MQDPGLNAESEKKKSLKWTLLENCIGWMSHLQNVVFFFFKRILFLGDVFGVVIAAT